jgi:hypothetical protein
LEQNPAWLRELLLSEFTEEELAALSRDIGINYTELPGMGAFGKTRALIESARARHGLRALVARVRILRPEAYAAAQTGEYERPTQAALPIGAAAPMAMEPPATPAQTGQRPATGGAAVKAIVIVAVVGLLAVLARAAIPPVPTAAPTGMPTSNASANLLGTPTSTPPLATTVPAEVIAAATRAPSTTPITTMTPPMAASATQSPTSPPVPSPAPSVTSPPQPTTAPQPASAPTPVRANTPIPQPTSVISQPIAAVQTVHELNEQLINFYLGKASVDTLRPFWSDETYQAMLNFAYRSIKSKVDVDLARGESMQASMRYVRPPAVIAQNGPIAQVSATEYWTYTNPHNNKTVCETRLYSYTMIQEDDRYRVMAFKGDLTGTTCEVGD